jgi:hypothetical protein
LLKNIDFEAEINEKSHAELIAILRELKFKNIMAVNNCAMMTNKASSLKVLTADLKSEIARQLSVFPVQNTLPNSFQNNVASRDFTSFTVHSNHSHSRIISETLHSISALLTEYSLLIVSLPHSYVSTKTSRGSDSNIKIFASELENSHEINVALSKLGGVLTTVKQLSSELTEKMRGLVSQKQSNIFAIREIESARDKKYVYFKHPY